MPPKYVTIYRIVLLRTYLVSKFQNPKSYSLKISAIKKYRDDPKIPNNLQDNFTFNLFVSKIDPKLTLPFSYNLCLIRLLLDYCFPN